VIKQSLLCIAGGFVIELLGGVCLALGISSVAKVLSVYPGSAIFYFIPRSVAGRLSETTLFYIGFVSGAVLWAAVLYLALVLGRALIVRSGADSGQAAN
jgi:hypothetical protein